MPPSIKQFTTFLFSPPLHEFWFLIAGLVGCYVFAVMFFHALPGDTTVVHRARRAWGLAFILHALIGVGVFAHWYLGHRLLPTFGNYAWISVLVIVVDLVVAVGLLTSGRRFRSYS